MKTLDLHGTRHHEVDLKVENFILMHQEDTPLTIICGNSQKMIDLVYDVINRIDLQTVVMNQYGVIVIREIWWTDLNIIGVTLCSGKSSGKSNLSSGSPKESSKKPTKNFKNLHKNPLFLVDKTPFGAILYV